MGRRALAVSIALSGLLAATIAGGASAQSPSAATSGGLTANAWLLSSVGAQPVASGVNADIAFTDEAASGFAGCNRFFGSYTTDGTSSLTFGPLATTMMACDDATNAFEQGYLGALATVASYAIDAQGTLTMSDATGAAVLTYAATPPDSVEGPWNVTGVNNGKEAVVSVPLGISASVSFHPDGTVEGFDGCNNFAGGYSVHDAAIAIGPLMGTLMACGDPADTFAQQYLTALQAATTWAIVSGGDLELRDDSGALQVSATSALGH
jgi:heat shock protein HslJ